MKITLTEPEVAGDYVLDERLEDGSLVLRPTPRPPRSVSVSAASR